MSQNKILNYVYCSGFSCIGKEFPLLNISHYSFFCLSSCKSCCALTSNLPCLIPCLLFQPALVKKMATDMAYEKTFIYSKVKENLPLYLACKWFRKKIYTVPKHFWVFKGTLYWGYHFICQICNIEKISLNFFFLTTISFLDQNQHQTQKQLYSYLGNSQSLPNIFQMSPQNRKSWWMNFYWLKMD